MMDGGGKKYDSEKPMMALLSPRGIEAEAQGMTYGSKKYGNHNWRNGIQVTRYISAALRHIFAFIRGEDIDPESGVAHLGLAKCNLGMALQTLEDHPHLDDRFKKAQETPIFKTAKNSDMCSCTGIVEYTDFLCNRCNKKVRL